MLDQFIKWFNRTDVHAIWRDTPYTPRQLDTLGMFSKKSIIGNFYQVEMENGKVSLLPTKQRGTSDMTNISGTKKHRRVVETPHIPASFSVVAGDLANVQGGSMDEAFASILAGRMIQARENYSATWEYHRVNAIKGIVLDSDGTELFNVYDFLGVSQQTQTLTVGDIGPGCDTLKETILDGLGNVGSSGVLVLCGKDFFDAVRNDEDVIANKNNVLPGTFASDSFVYSSFEYRGVIFMRYRGMVGSTPYIANNKGHAIPLGVADAFEHVDSTADTMSEIGKPGKEIVFTEEKLPFDAGVQFRLQSNRLTLPTRPSALVELTIDTGVTTTAAATTTAAPTTTT